MNTVPTKLHGFAAWNLATHKLGYDACSPCQISRDAMAQSPYREHSEMKLKSLDISGFESWEVYVTRKMFCKER